MYIARVPNRNSPPAILLRESYREQGKVKSRTLANLSKLPPDAIEVLQRSLKGERLVPADHSFEAIASQHHGHVHAVLLAMRRLRFAELIGARASHERNLVVAMVVARILEPSSKLATTRWWHVTTLPSLLEVTQADEDQLYHALDWLLERHDGNVSAAAREAEMDRKYLHKLAKKHGLK